MFVPDLIRSMFKMAPRHYDLAGKNALVTGGSRGLGLEVARRLVEKGAHVAITARDAAEIGRAVDDLRTRARGTDVLGVVCDLTQGDRIDAMLAQVRQDLGPIDVLVNNAGMIQVGPLDAMTVEDFEQTMKLHFFAPLRTMLGTRHDMRARGGGRVANVSSVGGLISVPHLLPYSASKFALVGLSEGMHAELLHDNIVVSTIAPGLMRTGSPRQATFKGDHENEHAWFTVSDSLPGLSVSSGTASRRIVRAIEEGEAHVVIGLPAQLGAVVHGLVPGLISRVMSAVTAVLPHGADRRAKHGYESESAVAPSVLTTLTDRAAVANNEM